VKRLWLPALATVGFAIAYGAAWFVVREKYRDTHSPAQQPNLQQGTPFDQVREVIRTETDLMRGTLHLLGIIPQLTPQQAWEILTELGQGEQSAAPIASQAVTLLHYRSEQDSEKSAHERDGAFPVFIFDYSNPFSLSSESVAAAANSFGSAITGGGQVRPVPMSAIHWALVWLDRRSPAEALAFIKELGPAWEESATKWLSDFVGDKTFAEATPWLDRIASPLVRSTVTDALLRKRMESDWEAARQWVMERPEERLPNAMNQAEAILNSSRLRTGEPSGSAAFLILTLAPEAQLRQIDRTGRLWQTLLLSRNPDFIAYLGSPSNRADLGTICERLTVHQGKFNEGEALQLLVLFDDRYQPGFQEKVRTELISIRARSRDETAWGPYSDPMLQLMGLPILPWSIPLPPAIEP
jgi:hypothetical protein